MNIERIKEVMLMSQKDIYIPDCLKESVENYLKNKNTTLWDCYYCELQTDINVAEIEGFAKGSLVKSIKHLAQSKVVVDVKSNAL